MPKAFIDTLAHSLTLTHLLLRSKGDLRPFTLLLSIPPFRDRSRSCALRLSAPERRSIAKCLLPNMFYSPSNESSPPSYVMG